MSLDFWVRSIDLIIRNFSLSSCFLYWIDFYLVKLFTAGQGSGSVVEHFLHVWGPGLFPHICLPTKTVFIIVLPSIICVKWSLKSLKCAQEDHGPLQKRPEGLSARTLQYLESPGVLWWYLDVSRALLEGPGGAEDWTGFAVCQTCLKPLQPLTFFIYFKVTPGSTGGFTPGSLEP